MVPHVSAVDEICHYVPALAEHRDAITRVECELHAKKFTIAVVSARNEARSWVDWTNGLLYLSVYNGCGGRSVLWDLLHELGHILSDEPELRGQPRTEAERTEQQRRERIAWESARTFIEEHAPDLKVHLEDFERRRDFCMKSYMRRAGSAS
jgi:hypothetical protein